MSDIEKGVPIPPSRRGRPKGNYSSALSIQLSQLAVTDSVFVPNVDHADVGGKVAGLAKSLNFKFTARQTTEEGISGVRIWRIADPV